MESCFSKVEIDFLSLGSLITCKFSNVKIPYCLTFAPMNPEKYEVVIGLEVHAQLLTKSKLFCGDSTAFGAEPNTQVSPISLAHPGTLPKMNKQQLSLL